MLPTFAIPGGIAASFVLLGLAMRKPFAQGFKQFRSKIHPQRVARRKKRASGQN
jgi:hypothetical protein